MNRLHHTIPLVLALLLLGHAAAWPQDTRAPAPASTPAANPHPAGPALNRELVIGTREAPPFAMKNADGAWEGISIDLWRRIADQLHIRYRIEDEGSVSDLISAVTSGKADVAVAALTITGDRQQIMDFTQPFYGTGLGVAVSPEGATRWLPILRTFLSLSFLQAVLALLGIALTVGLLVWLFERKDNQHFGGGVARGLTSGVWWSAVAMTQAGAAHQAPASLPGRILAVVWMVASIIALAVFTAGITSSLTTHQMQGLVRNLGDLRSLRVGVVGGSSSDDFLTRQRIGHRAFADARSGLREVERGRLDAFVYDKPLLAWTVRQGFPGLEVLTVSFDSQNYGFALPTDSPLRVPLDIAILDALRSDWWQETLYRYLGQAETSRAP